MKEIEDKNYGESGLDQDFFDDISDVKDKADVLSNNQNDGIQQALREHKLSDEIRDTPLFKEYYKVVSEGPGKDWDEYRRAKFTLQTMNRAGCIELPPIDRWDNINDSDSSHSGNVNINKQNEDMPASRKSGHNKGSVNLFDDFMPLSKDELKDNLMVAGGIVGVVILAIISVLIGIKNGSPGVAATGGAVSVAAFIAVAVRLAGHYHHRFNLKYRLTRLLVCLALIFSNAARFAVKEFWEQLCYITNSEIPIIPFGMISTAILLLMSLWSYIALCRTYSPPRAKTLGWMGALCVTFAIGSFLFSAIS